MKFEGEYMDTLIQKMRLIVNGAVCLYEGQGLDIPGILETHNREDLLIVLDALILALYWMQDEIEMHEAKLV